MKVEAKLFVLLGRVLRPRRAPLRHVHRLEGAGRARSACSCPPGCRADRLLPLGDRPPLTPAPRTTPRRRSRPEGEYGFFSPHCWWPLWLPPPRSASSASRSAGGCSSSAPSLVPWLHRLDLRVLQGRARHVASQLSVSGQPRLASERLFSMADLGRGVRQMPFSPEGRDPRVGWTY